MNMKINAAQRLTAAEDHVDAIKQLVAGYFGPKNVVGAEAHGSSVIVYLKKGLTADDLHWLVNRANCKSPLGVEVRPSQHSGTVAVLIDASRYQAPQHYTGNEDHP